MDYGYLSSQEDHGTLTLASDGARTLLAPIQTASGCDSRCGRTPIRRRGLWPIDHSMTILCVTPVPDIDAAAITRQDDRRWFPARGSKGNAVRALQHNAAAAPATVSGEPATSLPLGACVLLGRWSTAMTREPGDLPPQEVTRGRSRRGVLMWPDRSHRAAQR